jgi:hypothetical protein
MSGDTVPGKLFAVEARRRHTHPALMVGVSALDGGTVANPVASIAKAA